jgi:CheY-like chemotaxis protein
MLGLFKPKKKTDQARILVVDDEPDLISTIKCRLEWAKCHVITAANGKEGLQAAADEKPDLILLDNNMPEMTGPQMLERLKNDPDLKNIPVIMVTALCEPKDIAAVSSHGIAGYITKPFDFADLMNKITSILQNKKFN